MELLLRSARLAKIRGQVSEAEGTVRKVLTLQALNRDAAEMLGDILLEKGDAAGAKAALKTALDGHPGDVGLEEAYARAVLALSEAERAKAQAYSEAMRAGGRSGRSTVLPPVASLLICGLGQFLNEEAIKGVVMAVVGYLSLLLGFLIGGAPLTRAISSWLVGGNLAAATGRPAADVGRVSGLAVFLIVVCVLTWVVSIVDAGLVAKRRHGPRAGRTGWEV